jgi:alanine racemase
MTRPASVVINLAALKANLKRIRQLTPGRRIMAVVKADAYGHGLARVAHALAEADAFGVACLEEAGELREAEVRQPIVLLEGPYSGAEIPVIQKLGLEIVVHHAEQLAMLEKARTSQPVQVWLKIDTGMHRLGFDPEDVPAALQRLRGSAAVADGIRFMTHLACANDPGNPLTRRQIETFNASLRPYDGERSAANSAAILRWPESHADWVRPGLLLYGVSPLPSRTGADEGLAPVMTFRSQLIAVKRLRAGDAVGYGAAWRCPADMPIGIVAAGYGDGYPRHAPSGTPVLVGETRVALIGHASMDMLAVDLSARPDARVGEPVVLWGEGLPVEEIASSAGTIPYELLCGGRKRMRFIEYGQS